MDNERFEAFTMLETARPANPSTKDYHN